MNAQEAINVCRYVRAACPQQAMDEFTPQAWADLLTDVGYQDAQNAVKALAKRQPFVAPAEIIKEIGAVRRKRMDQYGTPDLPEDMHKPDFNSSPEEDREIDRRYSRYMTCVYELVADGTLTRADPQPSFTDLEPLIDAAIEADRRAALAASEQRQAKLASKINQVVSKLALSSKR